MAVRILRARDIERLENTSFAAAPVFLGQVSVGHDGDAADASTQPTCSTASTAATCCATYSVSCGCIDSVSGCESTPSTAVACCLTATVTCTTDGVGGAALANGRPPSAPALDVLPSKPTVPAGWSL